MSLDILRTDETDPGLFDQIESVLEAVGWQFERDGQEAVHCIVPTRWGEMGGLFACRTTPSALHFSLTVDVKPQAARRAVISELVIMMNERLKRLTGLCLRSTLLSGRAKAQPRRSRLLCSRPMARPNERWHPDK